MENPAPKWGRRNSILHTLVVVNSNKVTFFNLLCGECWCQQRSFQLVWQAGKGQRVHRIPSKIDYFGINWRSCHGFTYCDSWHVCLTTVLRQSGCWEIVYADISSLWTMMRLILSRFFLQQRPRRRTTLCCWDAAAPSVTCSWSLSDNNPHAAGERWRAQRVCSRCLLLPRCTLPRNWARYIPCLSRRLPLPPVLSSTFPCRSLFGRWGGAQCLSVSVFLPLKVSVGLFIHDICRPVARVMSLSSLSTSNSSCADPALTRLWSFLVRNERTKGPVCKTHASCLFLLFPLYCHELFFPCCNRVLHTIPAINNTVTEVTQRSPKVGVYVFSIKCNAVLWLFEWHMAAANVMKHESY